MSKVNIYGRYINEICQIFSSLSIIIVQNLVTIEFMGGRYFISVFLISIIFRLLTIFNYLLYEEKKEPLTIITWLMQLLSPHSIISYIQDLVHYHRYKICYVFKKPQTNVRMFCFNYFCCCCFFRTENSTLHFLYFRLDQYVNKSVFM